MKKTKQILLREFRAFAYIKRNSAKHILISAVPSRGCLLHPVVRFLHLACECKENARLLLQCCPLETVDEFGYAISMAGKHALPCPGRSRSDRRLPRFPETRSACISGL